MKNVCSRLAGCLAAGLLLALPFVVFSLSASAASSGADTFKAKCAMCHGADGAGSTPMGRKLKIQDLRSAGVQKQTDDELAAIITNGKPPMPAYGKSLAAADIQKLVTYLRSIATK
jgi:cytochrome c6